MFQVIFIHSDRTRGRDLNEEGVWAWVNMLRFIALSRIVNTINLKIFPNHGEIYRFKRKLYKYSGER